VSVWGYNIEGQGVYDRYGGYNIDGGGHDTDMGEGFACITSEFKIHERVNHVTLHYDKQN